MRGASACTTPLEPILLLRHAWESTLLRNTSPMTEGSYFSSLGHLIASAIRKIEFCNNEGSNSGFYP
jgi:hypothetical protein